MRAAETPGAIVNISSVAGLRGGLGYVDYVCSKAALTVLTQQAACELANAGIRVNSVAAAYVSTVRLPLNAPLVAWYHPQWIFCSMLRPLCRQIHQVMSGPGARAVFSMYMNIVLVRLA